VPRLEPGIARLAAASLDAAEEAGERLVEPPHRRLGGREVQPGEEGVGCPLSLEPRGLFLVLDRPLLGFVDRLPLAEASVVQPAMRFEGDPQLPKLIAVGVKPIFECPTHQDSPSTAAPPGAWLGKPRQLAMPTDCLRGTRERYCTASKADLGLSRCDDSDRREASDRHASAPPCHRSHPARPGRRTAHHIRPARYRIFGANGCFGADPCCRDSGPLPSLWQHPHSRHANGDTALSSSPGTQGG